MQYLRHLYEDDGLFNWVAILYFSLLNLATLTETL